MERKKALIPEIGIWISVFALLMLTSSGFMQRMESRDLFLWTWSFFTDRVTTAGGMLSWTGSLLTQFLRFPLLGAAVMTTLCWLCSYAFRKTFNAGWLASVSIALILLAAMSHSGYMIYKVKTPAYAIVPMLGFLSAVWGIGWFRKSGCNVLMMADWALLWYPLLGFYCLLGCLGMAVAFFTGPAGRKYRVGAVSMSLGLILVAPFVWHLVLKGSTLGRAYLAGLPLFPSSGRPFLYLAPYIVAFMLLVWAPLLFRNGNKKIETFVTVLAFAVSAAFWNKDGNFKAEMDMTAAIEKAQWEKVINNAPRYYQEKEPTRIMVLCKDLALFKTGREGNKMFQYKDGNCKQKTTVEINTALQVAKPLYYHYGLVRYCYRWCFESYAETGWSYEDLKYMAMSCLTLGETESAHKYLDILSHTLFYKNWAKRQMQYVISPESVKNSDEYAEICNILNREDWLDNDYSQPERFLSSYFTERMPEKAEPDYWRAALMWAARSCRADRFWDFYNKYVSECKPADLPIHWQEAVLLYARQAGLSTQNINLSEDIRKNFFSYQKYLSDHSGTEIDAGDFGSYFGNTYYCFYQFGQTDF